MKKLLNHWQGLTALLVAIVLFWMSGYGIRFIDSTAGVFDIGYIQRPLVAASYFFFATFCVWIAFQMEFPTLDDWLDQGGFKADWKKLSEASRISLICVILAFFLLIFIACLFLVPV